jgi:hypothetical protein
VSPSHQPFERLLRLSQILTDHSIDVRSAGSEPPHVRETRAQRIRQLTVELQHDGIESDEVDAVAMRLLLNDYAAVLPAYREMTRQAEVHLSAAAGPVKEVRRDLHRHEKLKLKRKARSARRDQSKV